MSFLSKSMSSGSKQSTIRPGRISDLHSLGDFHYSRRMRCDVCGSPDSVFFIRPDGADGELRLCRSCAIERGYATPGEGLGARLDAMASADEDAPSRRRCPSCGWTAERLKSTGKLGCPECAKAFKRDIEIRTRKTGRAGKYEGRVPLRGAVAGAAKQSDASLAQSSLAKELEAALMAEDFEAAAAIRDRLRLSDRR